MRLQPCLWTINLHLWSLDAKIYAFALYSIIGTIYYNLAFIAIFNCSFFMYNKYTQNYIIKELKTICLIKLDITFVLHLKPMEGKY
jgi:hypothetical protein